MTKRIAIQPLTPSVFAPFGDVLTTDDPSPKVINQGNCHRHHNRAALTFEQGDAGISIFEAKLRSLPLKLDMMERHPEGSQAFLPLCGSPFLVIVAQDDNGKPDYPLAFKTEPNTGINFHKNVWHGVLTPLSGSGRFAVVDQIGTTKNLEEHFFEEGYLVG